MVLKFSLAGLRAKNGTLDCKGSRPLVYRNISRASYRAVLEENQLKAAKT